MSKTSLVALAAALCMSSFTSQADAQAVAATPLTLIHRHELPISIKGHFDHLAIDPHGKRVFGTAVEGKVLVVFDLAKGKMVRAVPGIGEPRRVVYRSDLSRLYVSDGGGAVRIFDSNTFKSSDPGECSQHLAPGCPGRQDRCHWL